MQDSFGDNVSQWHAAITANSTGRVVAAWDDNRDGTPDVWLSDWDGTQFSAILPCPARAELVRNPIPLFIWMPRINCMWPGWKEARRAARGSDIQARCGNNRLPTLAKPLSSQNVRQHRRRRGLKSLPHPKRLSNSDNTIKPGLPFFGEFFPEWIAFDCFMLVSQL